MVFLRFLAWLTVRRVRASWQMMCVPFAGVLLAVTLTSVAATHDLTLAGMADRVKELVDGDFIEEASEQRPQLRSGE